MSGATIETGRTLAMGQDEAIVGGRDHDFDLCTHDRSPDRLPDGR